MYVLWSVCHIKIPNAFKTKLMVFGRNVSYVDVVFQGRIASKVNNEAHVGNICGPTDINNDAMSISKACDEMYAKLNLLYNQFDVCSPDVLYKLFNSYMSLYRSQLLDYENKSVMDSLYIA